MSYVGLDTYTVTVYTPGLLYLLHYTYAVRKVGLQINPSNNW